MTLQVLTRTMCAVSILLFTSRCTFSADSGLSAFAGTWRENPSGTHVGGGVLTFERTPDGNLKIIQRDGKQFTYVLDGNPHPDPGLPGAIVTWTAPNPSTLKNVTTLNGQLLFETTRTVSSDGNRLTSITRNRTGSGKTAVSTAISERASGQQNAFWGGWKLLSISTDLPAVMEIAISEDSTISLSQEVPDPFKFTAKLDGKPYAVSGPKTPTTVVLSDLGGNPSSMTLTVQENGKPAQIVKLTVSADGRTLIEEDREPGRTEIAVRQVYTRQ